MAEDTLWVKMKYGDIHGALIFDLSEPGRPAGKIRAIHWDGKDPKRVAEIDEKFRKYLDAQKTNPQGLSLIGGHSIPTNALAFCDTLLAALGKLEDKTALENLQGKETDLFDYKIQTYPESIAPEEGVIY